MPESRDESAPVCCRYSEPRNGICLKCGVPVDANGVPERTGDDEARDLPGLRELMQNPVIVDGKPVTPEPSGDDARAYSVSEPMATPLVVTPGSPLDRAWAGDTTFEGDEIESRVEAARAVVITHLDGLALELGEYDQRQTLHHDLSVFEQAVSEKARSDYERELLAAPAEELIALRRVERLCRETRRTIWPFSPLVDSALRTLDEVRARLAAPTEEANR